MMTDLQRRTTRPHGEVHFRSAMGLGVPCGHPAASPKYISSGRVAAAHSGPQCQPRYGRGVPASRHCGGRDGRNSALRGIGGPARTIIGVLIIAILGNGMIISPWTRIRSRSSKVSWSSPPVALTMDRRKMQLVK